MCRWVYYSAVNAITPQLVLNLGFEDNSWDIAIRQMSFQVTVILASLPIMYVLRPLFTWDLSTLSNISSFPTFPPPSTLHSEAYLPSHQANTSPSPPSWYATKYKDMKSPLLITFTLFLLVCCVYAGVRPTWSLPQYVLNVLCGIGQSGPLSLIVAVVQFTCPHAYLSTATGVAFTARAVGGAFGAAVLTSIINGHLSANYAANVGRAAVAAGLGEAQVPVLVAAMRSGNATRLRGVEGLTEEVLAEAVRSSRWTYAHAYRKAWGSIVPFSVLAIVCVWFLKDIKELMTERVEASLEKGQAKETEAKTVDDEV